MTLPLLLLLTLVQEPVQEPAGEAAPAKAPPALAFPQAMDFEPPEDEYLTGVSQDESGEVYPAQWLAEGRIVFLAPDPEVDLEKLTPVFTTNRFAVPPSRLGLEGATGGFNLLLDGERAIHYRARDPVRPFFFPVTGPGGISMTRNWPVGDIRPGEEKDHPHHRGMWFTHGSVNGHDFWAGIRDESPAKIVAYNMRRVPEGLVYGGLISRHFWIAPDRSRVMSDEQEFHLYALPRNRLYGFRASLIASEGPVKFGDTKEGTFGFRLHPALRLTGEVAKGQVVNSEGVRGKDAWGKRADWVDYWGPVEGRTLGVAIFDHPTNLRHPTWWHARDYGLVAANPFGAHDFEGAPEGTGDYTLEAGQTLVLRYAVYVHEGTPEEARVPEMYAAWCRLWQ